MVKNKMQTICCSFHCFLKYTLFCFVRTGFFFRISISALVQNGAPLHLVGYLQKLVSNFEALIFRQSNSLQPTMKQPQAEQKLNMVQNSTTDTESSSSVFELL